MPTAATRGTFWIVSAFYLLTAFEFFYMAAPFGVYFYSAYLPGLSFLDQTPGLGWLTQFFLPHIVADTTSWLVGSHNIVGVVLTGVGLLAFIMGASQVYYRKLSKKGPALGGIYKYIRHPQYTALAVAGLGMLLLWPRYLVLVIYVTMLFGYYFLSVIEERECSRKFGRPYLDYMARTGRFVPFRIPRPARSERDATPSWLYAAGKTILVYIAVLGVSVGAAYLLERLSVASLYAVTTDNAVYVSVGRIKKEKLKRLARIVRDDPEVRQRLAAASRNFVSPRFINYVLPSNWCVSEIPMHPPKGGSCGHRRPRPDGLRYTVVFTRADLPPRTRAAGRRILLVTRKRIPVLQITVDLNRGRVIKWKKPLSDRYRNVPVPIY